MALQFNIKPIAKQRMQRIKHLLCPRLLALLQQTPDRPVRPAGQTDQPSVMMAQVIKIDLRQLALVIQIRGRVQLHQVQIALLGLGQQNDRCRIWCTLARLWHRIGQRHLTADDRLDARL